MALGVAEGATVSCSTSLLLLYKRVEEAAAATASLSVPDVAA